MMSRIYTLKDLQRILPFGRNKVLQLCQVYALPVVKVGRSYITTDELLDRWIKDNIGKDILY